MTASNIKRVPVPVNGSYYLMVMNKGKKYPYSSTRQLERQAAQYQRSRLRTHRMYGVAR